MILQYPYTRKDVVLGRNALKGILSALIVASLIATATLPFASAAFPGRNGKIAFMSNRDRGVYDIYVMNEDGSGLTMLTNGTLGTENLYPKWSPDGTKIAFLGKRMDTAEYVAEVYVMNATGTGLKQLTNLHNSTYSPQWSPDGTKVLFSSRPLSNDHDYGVQIYVINADGSGQINLSNYTGDDNNPKWSPDGTKIAFNRFAYYNNSFGSRAYVVNADGTGLKQLALPDGAFYTNSYIFGWSPDGTKIIFRAYGPTADETIIMNIDGTAKEKFKDTNKILMNLSPDRTKVVFTKYSAPPEFTWNPSQNIFVENVDGTGLIQLTNDTWAQDVAVQDIVWSPDSKKIVFSTHQGNEGGEIYTINVDDSGSETNITNNSGQDLAPDWGVQSQSLPKQSLLTVNSVDLSGNPVQGVWTVIRATTNDTLAKTGYTPFAFNGSTNTSYKVSVANYDGKVFKYWKDTGSTDGTRTVDNLTSAANTTLTAVYDTGKSLRGSTSLTYTGTNGQPNLTIDAVTMDGGNRTLQMWTIIDPQESKGISTTYKVYATNGYQNLKFDHWSDNGSKDRFRTLTIGQDTTITAYYRTG